MMYKLSSIKLWLVSLIWVTCFLSYTFAQQKFHCDGDIFLSSVNGNTKTTSLFYIGKYTENWSLNKLPTVNTVQFNAIGFNVKDSLIYGIEPTRHQLFSIDATGKASVEAYIPLIGNYYAGDVDLEGNELVLFRKDTIAFIDLISHNVRYLKTSTVSNSSAYCTDIAFNFMTGELYGYDAISTRLVTIDTETGLIDNEKFQPIGYFSSIPAIFFNEMGNLYGIGTDFSTQSSFIYQFDLETGLTQKKGFDFFIGERDACSCPPSIRLFAQTDEVNFLPCSEIEFTYVVSNYSNNISTEVSFHETYPEGFVVVGIENNLGGTLVTSINSNEVTINDLTISKGADTLKVKVLIPETASGNYQILANLSINGNGGIKADNPQTIEKNDPIQINIKNIEGDFTKFYSDTLELCDEVINIDLPLYKDVKYSWNNGDSLNVIEVSESGHYEVTISSVCQSTVKTFEVIDSDFDIDIQTDISLDIGKSIEIAPTINSRTPITNINWTAIPPDPTLCTNCPSINITPKVDTRYILSVENSSLCMKYQDVIITINRYVYGPNAFTPNFDGNNDIFFLSSTGNSLQIKKMSIFDRWGGIVFEKLNGMTNMSDDGWNGSFQGNSAPSGVYIWVAELETPEGYPILKQGVISIIETK